MKYRAPVHSRRGIHKTIPSEKVKLEPSGLVVVKSYRIGIISGSTYLYSDSETESREGIGHGYRIVSVFSSVEKRGEKPFKCPSLRLEPIPKPPNAMELVPLMNRLMPGSPAVQVRLLKNTSDTH